MIDPYKVKMMPGQEPYTRAELERLYSLFDAVLEEEERLDIREGTEREFLERENRADREE
jgi:hypothetical protein